MKDEEKIREYLKKNGSLSRIFLPGANLRHTKLLAGMDLSFADLSNSDLTGADLSKCNLSHVNFSSADLRDAVFNDSNLRYAILEDAEIENASFVCVDLSYANISGLDVDEANFIGATFPEEDDDFDEDMEQSPPTCPFCNKEDNCDHLFLSYDETFGELGGGFLYNRIDPLSDRIKSFFSSYIKENGFDAEFVTNESTLHDVWLGILDRNSHYKFKSNDFDIDELCLAKVIIPFLIEFSELPTHYYISQCGIACESFNTNQYSEDPEKEFENLNGKLEELLGSLSGHKHNK